MVLLQVFLISKKLLGWQNKPRLLKVMSKQTVIPKVWRSEATSVLLFLFLCWTSIYLSHHFPATVLKGSIFESDSSRVFLTLPLFWLLPAFVLGTALYRIYDVRYLMGDSGLEAQSGVLSLRLVKTKVRYEDILSVEVIQGLLDRILQVGILEVSTSATGGVEVILEGVASPRALQEILLTERENRKKALSKTAE